MKPRIHHGATLVYREDLALGCPPKEAKPQTKKLYRLIHSFPPGEGDFDSHWSRRPDKRDDWRDDECKAQGVSLFISPIVALQKAKAKRMPQREVCAVSLTVESGPVEQTSTTHFTWWPLRDCDVLDLCSGV